MELFRVPWRSQMLWSSAALLGMCYNWEFNCAAEEFSNQTQAEGKNTSPSHSAHVSGRYFKYNISAEIEALFFKLFKLIEKKHLNLNPFLLLLQTSAVSWIILPQLDYYIPFWTMVRRQWNGQRKPSLRSKQRISSKFYLPPNWSPRLADSN